MRYTATGRHKGNISFHLVKNMFLFFPVGFKGNLSLLELFVFFRRGRKSNWRYPNTSPRGPLGFGAGAHGAAASFAPGAVQRPGAALQARVERGSFALRRFAGPFEGRERVVFFFGERARVVFF